MARPKKELEQVSAQLEVPEEHQPLEKETIESSGISLPIIEVPQSDPMASAPKDGTRLYLSEESTDLATLGYWKKTRTITRANRFKWLIGGKWVDAFGQNLRFEPKYWKDA